MFPKERVREILCKDKYLGRAFVIKGDDDMRFQLDLTVGEARELSELLKGLDHE